jgi:hypothetical protein
MMRGRSGPGPARDGAGTSEMMLRVGTSARWCCMLLRARDGAACWGEREMVLHVGTSARWCWSWEEEVEVEVEGAGGWWR